MGKDKQAEGKKSRLEWVLEFLKAVGPCLVVFTIIGGMYAVHVEREKEAAARYLNIIRDLGNDSNSVRSGAVITMDAYLKRSDKNYRKYREQSIYVLVNHLAVEKSPLVRATTQEVLANIGVKDDIIVQKLATVNRHLWEQSDLTPALLISGEQVSDNLQSIADTMIKILQRKKPKLSNQDPPKTLDMSRIYLASDDYSLKDVNFINVQLEGACLVRMNLEKCTMTECKLSGAHLNNAILREAKLRDVDLEGTHLAGAILEGVILNNAVLIGVDLTGANLKNANLTKAILEIATLKNANLVGAILEGANLQDAKLEGAILEDAILEHANLRMAKLIEADLRRADLRDANLTAAILQGANLEGANLGGANLEGADLRGVLLFSIDSKKFQKDLDKGTISKDLQQEFEKNGISVSQNTNVSIEEKDHRWLIDDKDNERTYTVRKEEWLNICKDTDSDLREIFSVDSKKFQRDLDKGSISKNLQQEFEKNDISVSQNTNVSIEEKDHRWRIDDKDNERTYTVRKEEWLNVCKETKFDFMGIKKAKKWQNAIFDDDVRQKLTNPQN